MEVEGRLPQSGDLCSQVTVEFRGKASYWMTSPRGKIQKENSRVRGLRTEQGTWQQQNVLVLGLVLSGHYMTVC